VAFSTSVTKSSGCSAALARTGTGGRSFAHHTISASRGQGHTQTQPTLETHRWPPKKSMCCSPARRWFSQSTLDRPELTEQLIAASDTADPPSRSRVSPERRGPRFPAPRPGRRGHRQRRRPPESRATVLFLTTDCVRARVPLSHDRSRLARRSAGAPFWTMSEHVAQAAGTSRPVARRSARAYGIRQRPFGLCRLVEASAAIKIPANLP